MSWGVRMEFQGLMDEFREHAVVWMMVFFVGILYWAFRPRFRRRPARDGGDEPGPDGE